MTPNSHEPTPAGDRPVGDRNEYKGELSLLELGSVLLANRRKIVRWALVGAVVLVLPAQLRPRTWTATASFVPEGTDDSSAGLLNLAGQFGVALPVGGSRPGQSPEFYVDLFTSRVILGPIVDDTVTVAAQGGAVKSVLGLVLDAEPPFTPAMRERGINALSQSIGASVGRTTGVVGISVTTEWPDVSLAIAERLIDAVNRFNLQTRQSKAGDERRFTEERLATARTGLTEAEDELSSFLARNRQFDRSPDLTFEYDRLQREVALRQQVLVGLAQAYEDVRMREVRDVPVITVIETPSLPVRSNPRRRVVRALTGLLVGAFAAILWSLAGEMFRRRLAERDEQAGRFTALLRDAKRDLTPWRGRSSGRVKVNKSQTPASTSEKRREKVADAAKL